MVRENLVTDGYLDLKEAARMLKIHPMTLRHLILRERVPGVIKVFGKYLIRKTELEQFAANYDPRPGHYTRKPWKWIEEALPRKQRSS